MEWSAIDFRQLMREEKKRMRQQQKVGGENDANADADANTNPNPNPSQLESSQSAHVPPWAHGPFSPQSFPRLDREKDCVCRNPSSIYYLNDFLASTTDREHLISWLQQLEPNRSVDNNNEQAALGRWTTLPHAERRVALFDARDKYANGNANNTTTNDASNNAKNNTLFPEPLQSLANSLVDAGVFDAAKNPPNHILINEYAGGHQGILPHTDGPAYYHRTATISLSPNAAASVLLNFTPRGSTSATTATATVTASMESNQEDPVLSVDHPAHVQVLLQGSGSLVVFEDVAYVHYLHSIDGGSGGGNGSGSGGTITSDSSSAHSHMMNTQQIPADTCVNSAAGTHPVSTDYRISLTFRHKY
jgi:hypothetical protein